MNVKIKNVIILPADYDAKKDLPVLYLLHGHGGMYYKAWITVKPNSPHATA